MAYIGQSISGGTFFYTGATGGLVAANQDYFISLQWGCQHTLVDGTKTAIGTGLANTMFMVSGCTGNTMNAGRVCYDIVINGYSDWYLPSKDELNEMYLAKSYISGLDIYNNYWSSSQYNDNCAWVQFFLNGTQSELGEKDQLYRVRPIRTF